MVVGRPRMSLAYFVVGSVVPLHVSGVLSGGRWLDYRRFIRGPLTSVHRSHRILFPYNINEAAMNSYLTILGFLAVVLSPILIPLAVTLVYQARRRMRHLTAAMHYRRTVRRQRVVAWRPAEQEG